eukprot:Selendium_serpulae@DN6447_c2_g4_i2.p1
MANRRMRDLIVTQLARWHEQKIDNKDEVAVGDIVVYKLGSYEKLSNEHITGEAKYRSKWSLPYRVMEKRDRVVMVKPLWREGRHRQVPVAQVKKLAGRIPQVLRKLGEHNIVSSHPPRQDSFSPVTPYLDMEEIDAGALSEQVPKRRRLLIGPTNVTKD